jgi:hypothetical protein
MDLEDFLQPEIAVTAAVAAAIFSPRGRKIIRRGVVYGTAGVLIAGDTITSFARNISQGAQQMQASANTSTHTPGQEQHTAEGTGG